MAKFININWIHNLSVIFITVIIMSASLNVHARSADIVTTYKDDKGWKIQVSGKDFYVKGVVWGYTPRGENYTYSLWNKPEQHIRDVLDHEFTLMKKANINPKVGEHVSCDTYGSNGNNR